MRPIVLALLLFPCAPVAAQVEVFEEADCGRWQAVAIPSADIGQAPASCDANLLYYGRDGRGDGRDFAAARACAYRQRAAQSADDTIDDARVFGGSGILMMIYANGDGVARNLPLARRFACEYGGAPAEVFGRLQHLDAIAGGATPQDGHDGRFDLCDDMTSGMMMGFCSAHEAEFARFQRAQAWQALQSRWTPAQRGAWQRLRNAADAYFGNRAELETDLSGTMRAAMSIGMREAHEAALLQAVQDFEQGKAPEAKAPLAKADAALNASYRRVMATLRAHPGDPYGPMGTISAEGIRETERSWLRYRDAWLAFAAARYPALSASTLAAWLSAQRSAELDELAVE